MTTNILSSADANPVTSGHDLSNCSAVQHLRLPSQPKIIRKLFVFIRDKVLFGSKSPTITRIGYLLNRTAAFKYMDIHSYSEITWDWAAHLPQDYDLIIALPRRGLIAGTYAAMRLGIPITTPNQMLEGKHMRGKLGIVRKAIIVDDSIASGKQMNEAKDTLSKRFPNIKFETGSPFVMKGRKADHPGMIFTRIVFGTDILQPLKIDKVGWDMDGVICADPKPGSSETDIEKHCKEAKPLHIPRVPIYLIATSRKEEHREATEQWLRKHNIIYEHLIMRKEGQDHTSTKVEAILRYTPKTFIESNPSTARSLCLLTGANILCYEEMRLY